MFGQNGSILVEEITRKTSGPQDTLGRHLQDLRISVTDRCNFRCLYCMPLDEYTWIRKAEILTFEEIVRLARIFVDLGVRKIRLTGGEPLVRQDLPILVRQLAGLQGLSELSLTTNGAYLADLAPDLKAAGLKRVNVSIDSLDAQKFKKITKRGDLAKVLAGVFTANRIGLRPIKINAVIEKGLNDDEILSLADFGRIHLFSMRFIEYMDVGNANSWRSDKIVTKAEILSIIRRQYPLREMGRSGGTAPAVDFEYVDGRGDVGVISSVTEPFCFGCTRARLTADGRLVTCLFSEKGFDLKSPLRQGATDQQLSSMIQGIWEKRVDRYSEERLEALTANQYDASHRRKIEMISLGG
ncbi:MAG: GTP 3',8-cyclase MoaA [Acidobacteriota bacterium]